MTEQEAKEIGKALYENITLEGTNVISVASYIKFVDMAIKSLEKQVAKKVVFVHPLQLDDGGDYMCPSCKTGTVYDAYGQQSHYCHYCGQKLNWEEV